MLEDIRRNVKYLTRKNEFAIHVYRKMLQPTQLFVPRPPVRISDRKIVTMTPTNLYPEYAAKSNNCDSFVMLSR